MNDLKPYLQTKDFLVTQEAFNLMYDVKMDMLVTKPTPLNFDKYYNTPAYISHQDYSTTFLDKVYHIVKYFSLTKKMRLIRGYSNGEMSLLDIGTGTGDFLIKASTKNWRAEGVEPNTFARTKAKEKGLSIAPSLDMVTSKKFQIITLWHVLEHIPNLDTQITLIEKLLNDNGTLIVAVPNYKSYDASYYGTHWAAYDAPRHIWHFSQKSISTLFQPYGLKVVKILPMYFDSYYVSILSEKYKHGKTNILNAFYRGLASNLKASRTTEYSSLIYILKK